MGVNLKLFFISKYFTSEFIFQAKVLDTNISGPNAPLMKIIPANKYTRSLVEVCSSKVPLASRLQPSGSFGDTWG